MMQTLLRAAARFAAFRLKISPPLFHNYMVEMILDWSTWGSPA